MDYSEIDEIADGVGQFTRAITESEALTIARRIVPDETYSIIHSLAFALQMKSRWDARHG